ncbi:MAG: hypothetical protein RIA62_13740 [Cyclobacteriaceae bacterium]
MNQLFKAFFFICLLFLCSYISKGTAFISSQSGNWNDGATWGNASPGTIGIDYPDNNGDDDITISAGHTVILQSNSTINSFIINVNGIFDYNNFTLNPGGTITPFISDQSGAFDNNNTWLNGTAPGTTDRAIIIKGHTVTVKDDQIQDIQIDAGAVISTNNNKDLTITATLIINGTFKLNQGNADLVVGPVDISGFGAVDGSASNAGALQVNASTTIAAGSDITLIGDVDISNSTTLTINGKVRVVNGNVTSGNATSRVTMGAAGELEIDGTLVTGGILDAVSNPGNTIEYYGNSAQNIKQPLSNTYYNLIISGTSTKTFPAADITIGGSLTINNGSLNVNSRNITIAGNWENNSTFTNIGSVTFNGAGTQNLTNPTSGQNFTNFTVNKSAGSSLVLNNDVVATTALTLTQGFINTGSYAFTLGSGSEGTLSVPGGCIIGTFGRYIALTSTSPFTYPIGTSSNARTAVITFDQIGLGRTAGIVYGRFIGSDPGNNGLPLTDDVTLYNSFNEGYWDFYVSGFSKGAGNTFDLALTGDGFSSFPIDANTRIMTRADASSAWTASGTHNTVSANTVSRDNITTFAGQFTFGDDTNCARPADPSITGSTEVCRNDNNQSYSVSLNSGNSYSWTVVGGTIDEAGGASTTGYVLNLNSITVDWGPTGQIGSVSVAEKNSCSSSNTITNAVNINSIPPSGLTGKILVAENSTGIAYSVTNAANTTYTWTITGGTQVSGGNTNAITVDWGSSGTGTVSVTATKTTPSCVASASTSIGVTKYVVVESNGTGGGNWSSGSTWITGTVPLNSESARILASDVVTLFGGGGDDIYSLIVNGTLDVNSKDIRVSGDFIINIGGVVTGTTGNVQLTGTAASPQNEIDGIGSVNGGFTIEVKGGNKTIAPTTVITQSGTGTKFNIDAGLTITNRGSIQIGGDLTGDAASSTWTNTSNSILIAGSSLLTIGTLNASASDNIVRYDGSTAANIKIPGSSYYNLSFQATNTKTVTGAVDVNGNLTLTSGTLALGANNINVAGNLDYITGTITATTGAIIMDGSGNQVVTGVVTIPRWTINNTNSGNSITLSNNVTVSNVLTLTDGIISTGTNVLTISNTATSGISGGSSASFVAGKLARQTNTMGLYDFPVGVSNTFKRAGITPTLAIGATYQVEAFNSAYSDVTNLGIGLNNVSALEYWNITGSSPGQVRIYWETQSASDITLASDLRLANYTGGQWENQGNTNGGDTDPGYVGSVIALTTFGPVTFGSASGSENPLPVELLSFTGAEVEGKVVLDWVTATEIDNDYFLIERSANAIDFVSIGQVKGFGTSKEKHSYTFTDASPHRSITYYRLKQVDFDGDFEHSSIIYVRHGGNSDSFSIYPNPVNEFTRLRMGGYADIPLKIRIITISGKQIIDFNGSLNTFNEHFGRTMDHQVPGTYLLIVESDLGIFKAKLVK